MRLCIITAIILSATVAVPMAHAGEYDSGIDGDSNFAVISQPGDFLAADILAEANRLRDAIATEWYGQPLGTGDEYTVIQTKLCGDCFDRGLCVLNTGRVEGTTHWVWLSGDRCDLIGGTLAHEVAHVVLAHKFPHGRPLWLHEGIASRYDDSRRKYLREEMLEINVTERINWVGNGPGNVVNGRPQLVDFGRMLTAKDSSARHYDPLDYAIAESLIEFLLTKGDKSDVIRFGEIGLSDSWETALKTVYEIGSVKDLERQWWEWASD